MLEQSARLLYKESFIHFRLPGHEHVTIKDSVPEGWERKTVPEVIQINPKNQVPKDRDLLLPRLMSGELAV